jgi:hypothetical protein
VRGHQRVDRDRAGKAETRFQRHHSEGRPLPQPRSVAGP